MAAPQAPSMVIQEIASQSAPGNERDGVRVRVVLSGGTYDPALTEFSWSVVEHHTVHGHLFDDATLQNPWMTFPDVTTDGTRFTARCMGTFYGTGAEASQSVTNSDTETFYVNNVPDAAAPNNYAVDFLDFFGDPHPTAKERQHVRVSFDHDETSGHYDYVTYYWFFDERIGVELYDHSDLIISGRHSQECVIQMPDVPDTATQPKRMRVYCETDYFGSNGQRQDAQNRGPALRGTKAPTHASQDILVEDITNANAPTPIRIRHLSLNLGQTPNSFSGYDTEREADTAIIEYGTNNPHWLASYDADQHLILEVGYGDQWEYQRRVNNTWTALEPPSTTRGIPEPAPADPLWRNGFGTDRLNAITYYQVVFDDDDPEQIPSANYDGNLEWHWYLVPVVNGLRLDGNKIQIPETRETNRKQIKWQRTTYGLGGTHYAMQAEVVARGNDGNAEKGTISRKRVDSAVGETISPDPLTFPTVKIAPIQTGFERTTFVPSVTFTGGNYHEISYRWSMLDHDREDVTQDDTFLPNRNARIPTSVKRPVVTSTDGETLTFYLALNVTVTGEPPSSASGTKTQLTERILYVEDHQPAQAPSVEPELSFVVTDNNGQPGEVWRIFAYIGRTAAGLYDNIEYLWHLYPHGEPQNHQTDRATTFIHPYNVGVANLTFPFNEGSQAAEWTLRLQVNVSGDDTHASRGSTATSYGEVTFSVNPPPDPLTPFVTINPVPDGKTGETAELSVRVHTATGEQGRFDYLEGRWLLEDYAIQNRAYFTPWVRADDASFTFPVRWPYPVVSESTQFYVNFELIAHGDGHVAKNGATAAERDVRVRARVNPRSAIPENPLTPAQNLSVFVADENGSAQSIMNVYVTDGDSMPTEINGMYVTDDDGTATHIYGGEDGD